MNIELENIKQQILADSEHSIYTDLKLFKEYIHKRYYEQCPIDPEENLYNIMEVVKDSFKSLMRYAYLPNESNRAEWNKISHNDDLWNEFKLFLEIDPFYKNELKRLKRILKYTGSVSEKITWTYKQLNRQGELIEKEIDPSEYRNDFDKALIKFEKLHNDSYNLSTRNKAVIWLELNYFQIYSNLNRFTKQNEPLFIEEDNILIWTGSPQLLATLIQSNYGGSRNKEIAKYIQIKGNHGESKEIKYSSLNSQMDKVTENVRGWERLVSIFPDIQISPKS